MRVFLLDTILFLFQVVCPSVAINSIPILHSSYIHQSFSAWTHSHSAPNEFYVYCPFDANLNDTALTMLALLEKYSTYM